MFDQIELAGEFFESECFDVRWRAAFAVAALVRGDDPVTGGNEGPELVPPGVRELGEAVEQDHERSVASVMDAQTDAVAFDPGSFGPGDHPPANASGAKVSAMCPASRSCAISSSESPRTSR